MISFGDFVNWVEPNGNYENYCIQCGRKTGKNAYLVNVSIGGCVIRELGPEFIVFALRGVATP